jgi:transcriptional regulator with XRE-family HTH domain
MKEILSKRLRECRKELGLSQLQVSIYCDISEKAYQNYELMTREPRVEILVRLADLYHVSLDYLTGRTNERGKWT